METTTDSESGAQADDVADVLAGIRSYDDIDERSQAVVRAQWQRRIDVALKQLDLRAEFVACGAPYAELSEEKVVLR